MSRHTTIEKLVILELIRLVKEKPIKKTNQPRRRVAPSSLH